MHAAAATPELRRRPLSVHKESNGTAATGKTAGARIDGQAGHADDVGEPVDPSARLVEDFYIVVVIGISTPVNIAAARAGIEAQLARYPHFRSIQV